MTFECNILFSTTISLTSASKSLFIASSLLVSAFLISSPILWICESNLLVIESNFLDSVCIILASANFLRLSADLIISSKYVTFSIAISRSAFIFSISSSSVFLLCSFSVVCSAFNYMTSLFYQYCYYNLKCL